MKISRRRPEASRASRHQGFTLIELLVVLAIIAILISLLLPAINGGKEQAKLGKCINNQRQIGFAFKLYSDDYDTRFPVLGDWSNPAFAIGGGDPDGSVKEWPNMPAATNRPLWGYMPSREIFKCPSDRGADIRPFWSKAVKSVFAAGGSSYRYNSNPWVPTRRTLADPINGLAGKPESWILEPARHVLLDEPPALPWFADDGRPFLHQWHYPSGPVTTRDLKNLSKKTVAPVLFIDGHVKHFNLKRHFQLNPMYYAEPTSERVWYREKD